jgi:hypothetical protein
MYSSFLLGQSRDHFDHFINHGGREQFHQMECILWHICIYDPPLYHQKKIYHGTLG